MALNESQVLAKTRHQDLKSVKKLNCWGSDLTDVSLVRRLDNVEVLCLSCNQITTLEDFAYCPKLKELILRNNKIASISEVDYLQSIPELTNLWLDENPCAESNPNYRKQVLRRLPNLKVLDNIPVTREELNNLNVPDADEKELQSDHQEVENSEQVSESNSLQFNAYNQNDIDESVTNYSNQPNNACSSLQDSSGWNQESNSMSAYNASATSNAAINELYINQLNLRGSLKNLNSSRLSLKSTPRGRGANSTLYGCGQCQTDISTTANNNCSNSNLTSSSANNIKSLNDKLVKVVLLLVEELEFSECIPILDVIHSKLRDK